MPSCNECKALDREITRQKQEVVRWKSRATTYKNKLSKIQRQLDALSASNARLRNLCQEAAFVIEDRRAAEIQMNVSGLLDILKDVATNY